MNNKKISALRRLKSNLLLLTLAGVLGACANSNNKQKDELDTSDIVSLDELFEYNLSITVEEEVEESNTEIVQEEVIIDPLEIIMSLIDNESIQKIYYATSDIELTIPSYLSDSNIEETVTLPKLECLEVYDEVDDLYLVKTNEYIGYIKKDNLEELTGTFVVVDISSQEVKLYSDNQVILTTPVVTGKPSTPSDKGIFEIYDISGPRYLVGPNYRSYVDIMMKYNGGEGLHDAQYHKHEDGFKHGWRDISEFGGETYLTDGSHGCINMLHDAAMIVRDNVDIGTKVLVKE